jgi:hypothetical protein
MLILVLIMMFLSAYFNDFKCYKSRALVITYKTYQLSSETFNKNSVRLEIKQ